MKNEYVRVFRALSDEKRVQILGKLCEGEQCACNLLSGLEISQSTLSHHMKILCESGLVRGERVGPWMYYSINHDGGDHARKLIDAITSKDMKQWLTVFRMIGKAIKPFKPAISGISVDSNCGCCTSTGKVGSE